MSRISVGAVRYLRALVETPIHRSPIPLSSQTRCNHLHSLRRRRLGPSSHLDCRSFSVCSRKDQHKQQASSPPRTYYDLFPSSLPSGPPPTGSFALDTRALRKEFLQLQAKAHPDLHAAEDKARAEATSAYINEAYKTLLNPLLRAQYLLSLRGVDVANDETAKVEDPELLMLVLELRERVEEAESEEEIEEMKQENEKRIAVSEKILDEIFRDETRTEEAKSEAVKLRYWVNVRESLDAWEKGKEVPPLVH